MVKALTELQKEVKESVGKKSEDEKPSYANSNKNPASSCEAIRAAENMKRKGYYWIKMKCMPEPERVFCDMDQNFPNFYLFKGYPAEKKQEFEGADSVEGIRKICGSIGLQPVAIKSSASFVNMLEYLKESGSSSTDEFAIPFAFKYDQGEDAKFKSLNDRESADNFDAIKHNIHKSFVDLLSGGDTYYQIGEHDQLQLGYLKNIKIRGVLCSPNLEKPNPNDQP